MAFNSSKMRIRRAELGWRQRELAERAKKYGTISRQSISDWENGRTIPTLDKVKVLADTMDVTVDYFLN